MSTTRRRARANDWTRAGVLALLLLPAVDGGCGASDDPAAADLGDLGGPPDSGLDPDQGGAADLGPVVDAGTDGGPEELGVTWDYRPITPPAGPLPAALQGATWLAHLHDDLLPYWTQPAALGEPPGNYPTYRGMDGTVQGPAEVRPRMLGRQIFHYCAAYLLTGDAALLGHARAGIDWLLAHAKDGERGGYHALLDGRGTPSGGLDRTAQDLSYVLLGFAAYHFVTRDPVAEAELLAGRDLLFDPAGYWDAANRRIRDARTADMTAEVDQEGDGGWELVAQLDPINAFLLLAQPVLTDAARRAQFLNDLDVLSRTIQERFWSAGIFWGVSSKQGQYGARHVDFGHTLKSYWMLLSVDRRLPGHPYHAFLQEHLPPALDRAYGAAHGRWAKRPRSATEVEYGSDWWAYAEADQLAGALALLLPGQTARLAATTGHWLSDYVDRTRPAREVVSSIRRDGSWVWGWTAADTAKCNEWKNGFHSAEHALVLYLVGQQLAGEDATLHFAVPPAQAGTFVATPYTFAGRATGRQEGGTFPLGGQELRQVTVRFTEIH